MKILLLGCFVYIYNICHFSKHRFIDLLVHYIVWHSLFVLETGLFKFASLDDKALRSIVLLFCLPTLSRSLQAFSLALLTLTTGNHLFISLVIHLGDGSPRCSTLSLVTLDKSILIFISIAKFNLVMCRLVRLVLKLAFLHVLALNSLLFASCLPFEIWIAFGDVTFHVWHFIISCRSP